MVGHLPHLAVGAIGFNVVVYLAALQDIPQEVVEAAMIDGANRARCSGTSRCRRWRPVTVFTAVWQTITALQLFDLVYTTTRGRTARRDETIVYYLYAQAFQFPHYGYGSAVAYGLFAVTMLITLGMVCYARTRRWRHSDGREPPGGHRRAAQGDHRNRAAPPSRLAAVQRLAPAADADRAAVPLPLVQMVLASFMADGEINRFPPRFFPSHLAHRRLLGLFTDAPIVRWLLQLHDRRVVAVRLAPGPVLAGWLRFARLHFHGATVGFFLMVAHHHDPDPAADDPDVHHVQPARPGRHPGGAFVPWLASRVRHLLDAAVLPVPAGRARGRRRASTAATDFGVFWRIVLPLAKPALATLAVFTLLGAWNDLIWPLIAISNEHWYTIQLGLANFQGTRRTQWSAAHGGQRRGHDAADRRLPARAAAIRRHHDLQRPSRGDPLDDDGDGAFGHVARLHTGIDVSVDRDVDLRGAFEVLAVDALPATGRHHHRPRRRAPLEHRGDEDASPSRNWSWTSRSRGGRPRASGSVPRCGRRVRISSRISGSSCCLRSTAARTAARCSSSRTRQGAARTASSGTAPRTGRSGRTVRVEAALGEKSASSPPPTMSGQTKGCPIRPCAIALGIREARPPATPSAACRGGAVRAAVRPCFQQARYSLNA